jgi:ankyrin repeat protein
MHVEHQEVNELTATQWLTLFFTEDEDYNTAARYVRATGSPPTQEEKILATKYLEENDKFQAHPDPDRLVWVCDTFLRRTDASTGDQDSARDNDFQDRFRKSQIMQALTADERLLECIRDADDSDLSAVFHFSEQYLRQKTVTEKGLDLLFFAALSNNTEFFNKLNDVIMTKSYLRIKHELNAVYTRHQLNLLHATALMGNLELMTQFIGQGLPYHSRMILPEGTTNTPLQFFVNCHNSQAVKIFIKALDHLNHQAMVNAIDNITKEPIDSVTQPQDLLSYAIMLPSTEDNAGREKAFFLEVLAVCYPHIALTSNLENLINESILDVNERTLVLELLKSKNPELLQQLNLNTTTGELPMTPQRSTQVNPEHSVGELELTRDASLQKSPHRSPLPAPSNTVTTKPQEHSTGELELTSDAPLQKAPHTSPPPAPAPSNTSTAKPQEHSTGELELTSDVPLQKAPHTSPAPAPAPSNTSTTKPQERSTGELELTRDSSHVPTQPNSTPPPQQPAKSPVSVASNAAPFSGLPRPNFNAATKNRSSEAASNSELTLTPQTGAGMSAAPAIRIEAAPSSSSKTASQQQQEELDRATTFGTENIVSQKLADAFTQRTTTSTDPKETVIAKSTQGQPEKTSPEVEPSNSSLRWKLLEAVIALLEKPETYEDSEDSKEIMATKENYARHFDFLVQNNPLRAEKLLKRLNEIAQENPQPLLSTLDYVYILAGDINGLTFSKMQTLDESRVHVLLKEGNSQGVDTLKIKTTHRGTETIRASGVHRKDGKISFCPIIPISKKVTHPDFLKKTLQDKSGRSLLHWAAIGGSNEMRVLLEEKLENLSLAFPNLAPSIPQPSSPDCLGNTVAHEVARAGIYTTTVSNEHRIELTVLGEKLAFNHIKSTGITDHLSSSTLRSLTKKFDFFSPRNRAIKLPLHLAIEENNRLLLKVLLFKNPSAPLLDIDQDLRNGTKTNVLQFASLCPSVEMDTLRLVASADANLIRHRDAQGYTALGYAATISNVPAQLLLISLGADPLAKSFDGDTPLALALSASTIQVPDLHDRMMPLQRCTRIAAVNAIIERERLEMDGMEDEVSIRYITEKELRSLDELLSHPEITAKFTPQELDRLKLASFKTFEEKLQKSKYKNHPVPVFKQDVKLATRMHEYALAPIALYHGRNASVGAQEEAACADNLKAQQRLRLCQYYAEFHRDESFSILGSTSAFFANRHKTYIEEYGFDELSSGEELSLANVKLNLVEATNGFKNLLKHYVAMWGDPWETEEKQIGGKTVEVPKLDQGRRIPSWGQWFSSFNYARHYPSIALKLLDKIERFESKETMTKVQLLKFIEEAIRKADKQLIHVDEDSSDVKASEFRARCLTAQALALKLTDHSERPLESGASASFVEFLN